MSELTVCNRCTYNDIKKRLDGNIQVVEAPAPGFPRGVEVFSATGKQLAWFAELSEECVC